MIENVPSFESPVPEPAATQPAAAPQMPDRQPAIETGGMEAEAVAWWTFGIGLTVLAGAILAIVTESNSYSPDLAVPLMVATISGATAGIAFLAGILLAGIRQLSERRRV